MSTRTEHGILPGIPTQTSATEQPAGVPSVAHTTTPPCFETSGGSCCAYNPPTMKGEITMTYFTNISEESNGADKALNAARTDDGRTGQNGMAAEPPVPPVLPDAAEEPAVAVGKDTGTPVLDDKKFEDVAPPASAEEDAMLEASTLEKGCYETIITWNNIILKGHRQYKIAKSHGLPFDIVEMDFADEEEAEIWIIGSLLAQQSLTKMQRTYLMGKRYRLQKKRHGAEAGGRGNQHSKVVSGQNVHSPKDKTAEQIAQEQHVSERTVRRADKYSTAIDTVAANSGKTPNEILELTVNTNLQDVQELAEQPGDVQRESIEAVATGRANSVADVIHARKIDRERSASSHAPSTPDDSGIIEERTIGNIRIILGDSFEVMPNLNVIADAVISDPPYGVTGEKWDKVPPLEKMWQSFKAICKPTANLILFSSGKFRDKLWMSNPKWHRYDVIWAKNNKTGCRNAKYQPMESHENILVFGHPGKKKAARVST